MEKDTSRTLLQNPTNQLDNILEELGNFGKYQRRIFALITLTSMFAGIFSTAFLFATLETPYRCEIPGCENGEFEPPWLSIAIPVDENNFESCYRYAPTNIKFQDFIDSHADFNSNSSQITIEDSSNYSPSCQNDRFDKQVTVPCNGMIYKTSHSIVSEFDLGCNEWKRTMVGTMNNIGQLVGMPLTGFVGDRLGRRVALVGALLAVGVLGILKSFSVNYLMFLALEFGDGLFGCGIYASGFIMSVEYFGPKHRVLASTLTCICYTIGEVILGFIAFYFPYWRILLRVVYSITAIYLSYFWLIPESYRWLLSKGRSAEAVDIFNKAARINGVTLSKKSMDILSNYNVKNINKTYSESNDDNAATYYHVLRSHSIMFRVFCASIWFITSTFVYYGLSLNSVSVSGDLYVNYTLVSLVEIPAYVLYYLVVDSLGRKLSLTCAFLGSGLSCIAFAFVPTEPTWIRILLFLFGKFSITIAFAIVYVYSTELFPTPLRASLLGTCSMFGRIGSMIAPQTPLLGAYMESLPLLLYGGASIFSGITVLTFPETNKIKLPDTIEEAENLHRPRKSAT